MLFEWRLLDLSPLLSLLDAWEVLLLAFLLTGSTWPLVAWRWRILLATQGMRPEFGKVFRICYGSAFVGLYLPGTVGSDIARVAFGLSLPRSAVTGLTLSVIVDRVAGLVGLVLVGLCASLIYLWQLDTNSANYDDIRRLVLSLIGVFAAVVLVIVLGTALARQLHVKAEQAGWSAKGLVRRTAAQAIGAAKLYGSSPRALAGAVLISVTVHSLSLAALTLLAWKIGLGDAQPWKYAMAGAITAVVNALSITPGGIGIGEFAFAQVLLWLDPEARPVPYATIFLAHRLISALTLLPALGAMPNPLRREQP